MPFQSEKQRRYLWANEPEIARDWADTYGSRIQNNTGGISRLGFEAGSKDYLDFESWYRARDNFQKEQSIEELRKDYYRDKELQKVQNQKSMAATGGIMRLGYANGPPGGGDPEMKGTGQSYGDSYGPGRTYSPHEGLGATDPFKGAAPGMSTSTPHIPTQPQGFFGNLKDKIFQGRGDYETQADWQDAKDERIGQKRIDRILNRSDEFPITENTYKNLTDAGWEGGLPSLGSTATSRGDRNTYEGIRSVDVPQNKLVDIAKSVTTNQADAIPISGQNDYWNALNMKPMNIGYIPKEFKPSGNYSDSLAKALHKKATTEGIGAIQFENWMKNDGSMLQKEHPDYANTLLKELKISDAEKLYPRDNLDVKGRNTEKKQREALNTLMGKIETAKNQPDTNSINIRGDLVGDYIKNADKYNDLGITDIDQFKEFINIYVPKDNYT